MSEKFDWKKILFYIVENIGYIEDINDMRQWFIDYIFRLVLEANKRIGK